MQIIKKEIEDLYYLEVTSKYIVVNDLYHGINIMDFDLNMVRSIELEEDIVINFSIKHEDELLLFCYENECAFYVNLKTESVCRYDLSDYKDTYFSNIYFWKDNIVYLFADGSELSVKVDLNSADMIKLSSSDFVGLSLKKQYTELLSKDILSYNNDNGSALIIQNSNYCVWYPDNQIAIDMNIVALNQKKENIPSEQIYCKTSYSQDTVVCISEKVIMVTAKEKEDLYIYPPYELYRFFDGKIADYNGEIFLFALCHDNSSDGASLLMRYNELLIV